MSSATWRVWLALGVVYVVWGSTYLAIKVAVRTLPPLLAAGTRFLAAGALLALVLAATGRVVLASRRETLAAAATGVLMLGAGVGIVHLAETRITSATAAMIAGSVPLQIVLYRWLARDRAARRTVAAALVGVGGLALVVLPTAGEGASTAIGAALMLGATVAWATGSYASTRLPLPRDPFTGTTISMLAGGAALVVAGLAAGETGDLDAAAFEAGPVLAWAYLVVAGSLVAFSAYAWLLHRAPISLVVTHQFVNPVVAIALGAVVLGEPLSATTLAGAAIVIGAVFVTVRSESRARAVVLSPAVDSAA